MQRRRRSAERAARPAAWRTALSLAGASLIAIAAGSGAARAGAINYVTNGSFEQSTATASGGGFYGWTLATAAGASAPGKGPQIITTNGVTKGPYGDVIVSDSVQSPNPDADKGGAHAVYFVDDTASETITQRFWLSAGTYEVGFDLYATASGYGNLNNALFTASIAGTTITAANVSQYPRATWQHFGANAAVQTAGYYTASFTFLSGAVPAKDIVVDNVYVIDPPSLPGAGTLVAASVPEPAAPALFAVGLLALAAARRRIARSWSAFIVF